MPKTHAEKRSTPEVPAVPEGGRVWRAAERFVDWLAFAIARWRTLRRHYKLMRVYENSRIKSAYKAWRNYRGKPSRINRRWWK